MVWAMAVHVRDNIVLRWMADNLDLGYDLFDAVMLRREVQAKNMADSMIEIALAGSTIVRQSCGNCR